MNQYYALLYHVFTHSPCTRIHLEHLERGRFIDQIDACIEKEYIVTYANNENGDALYNITETGKKIINNPKENAE